MSHITPTATAPVFSHQVPGGVLLEVYLREGESGYIGYCDGEPSVTGAKPEIVLRGLERKHLAAPVPACAANVIDMAEARLRLRPNG